MSLSCYRHYCLRVSQSGRAAPEDSTTRAARLVFEAIMEDATTQAARQIFEAIMSVPDLRPRRTAYRDD